MNERTPAWFVRYERRLDVLLGSHPLAAGPIRLRFVERPGRRVDPAAGTMPGDPYAGPTERVAPRR